MRKLISLRHALTDDAWLGTMLGAPSFAVMRTLLIAAMGEPLDEPGELETFTQLTGRTVAPASSVQRRGNVDHCRPPLWQKSRDCGPCVVPRGMLRSSRRVGPRRAWNVAGSRGEHGTSRADFQFLPGNFHRHSAVCGSRAKFGRAAFWRQERRNMLAQPDRYCNPAGKFSNYPGHYEHWGNLRGNFDLAVRRKQKSRPRNFERNPAEPCDDGRDAVLHRITSCAAR